VNKLRLMVLAGLLSALFAQNPGETARQMWNTDFLDKRPAPPSDSKPRANVLYRRVPSDSTSLPTQPTSSSSDQIFGLTFWRMRPVGKTNDNNRARLLVLEPGPDTAREVEPERVEADTPFSGGDQVRLSFEAPSFGYLYVVDRENYADGKLGDPYLIYPNWQTHSGDNVVAPGRVLEIPDQAARPNVFTMRPSRPENTGELISVLITPMSLDRLTISRNPLKIDTAEYLNWEKQWGVAAEHLELVGGTGQGWTEREKQAGAHHQLLLSQNDAPPQTLYRIPTKPGQPVLIKLALRIKQ
jgi:hypothetical protein